MNDWQKDKEFKVLNWEWKGIACRRILLMLPNFWRAIPGIPLIVLALTFELLGEAFERASFYCSRWVDAIPYWNIVFVQRQMIQTDARRREIRQEVRKIQKRYTNIKSINKRPCLICDQQFDRNSEDQAICEICEGSPEMVGIGNTRPSVDKK